MLFKNEFPAKHQQRWHFNCLTWIDCQHSQNGTHARISTKYGWRGGREGGGRLGSGYASSNYNYITPRQPDIKLQNTYVYIYIRNETGCCMSCLGLSQITESGTEAAKERHLIWHFSVLIWKLWCVVGCYLFQGFRLKFPANFSVLISLLLAVHARIIYGLRAFWGFFVFALRNRKSAGVFGTGIAILSHFVGAPTLMERLTG